jgi:tetratricopeptide (TPR) repeat protein
LTVGDAIRSAVEAVDGFVFIESGGGGAALRAAYEAAPKQAHTAHYDWVGDYGAARNFALNTARDLGAEYALTLDPDERIHDAATIRATVEANPESFVFIAKCVGEGYSKERVLKCKSDLNWHGRVCEMLRGNPLPQVKLRATFSELPKNEGAETRRRERGVVACQQMIDEGDDCYRWRRHMGACLMGLGRREEALVQYQKAFDMAQHDEEKAWSWYLLCEQTVLDGHLEKAMGDAAKGLVDHAGYLPEFGWVIAYCQLQAGNHQNASRWAQLALNCPDDQTRLSFRSAVAKAGCRDIMAKLHGPRPDGGFTESGFERRNAYRPNYMTLAGALVALLAPDKHLDLGAGQGLLVEAMLTAGVASHGIELSEEAKTVALEHLKDHMTYGWGLADWGRVAQADLVSSVEVLEHLPEENADEAVAAICGRSKQWVYFSAAAPGQAGNGHINCQPKPYWRAKFEANGFRFAEAETAAFVAKIHDLQPCWWLPKNAMIFRKEGTE